MKLPPPAMAFRAPAKVAAAIGRWRALGSKIRFITYVESEHRLQHLHRCQFTPHANHSPRQRLWQIMNAMQNFSAIPIFVSLMPLLPSRSTPPPKPCDRPEQKQFDFWVGDWDLTSPGSKAGEVVHSSNTIKRILGSCIVQENFVGSCCSRPSSTTAGHKCFGLSMFLRQMETDLGGQSGQLSWISPANFKDNANDSFPGSHTS